MGLQGGLFVVQGQQANIQTGGGRGLYNIFHLADLFFNEIKQLSIILPQPLPTINFLLFQNEVQRFIQRNDDSIVSKIVLEQLDDIVEKLHQKLRLIVGDLSQVVAQLCQTVLYDAF